MNYLFLIGVMLCSLVNISNGNIIINRITRNEKDKLYASDASYKIYIMLIKYIFLIIVMFDTIFNEDTNNNRTCVYCNVDLSSGGTRILIPGFNNKKKCNFYINDMWHF